MNVSQTLAPASKIIMTLSAYVLGISGLSLLFFPEEIMEFLTQSNQNAILLQIIGAAYFGFAMSNWTAKHSIMGGIYGRAILIGNLSHFMTGGILITKYYLKTSNTTFLIISIVYILFLITFGYLFMNNPKTVK
ncbi:hypothetical protein OO013_02685 [Mangrovivirga sp. M17]|uniref:Uncharacterized protein n=1 Tax=Mangrovivirga halotolerans TaxID=2993936 RepID=A0ABT3RN41_9BACT|nr:hypothetical protein [Mangrovivirga halotolerans]MCX2742753.1 hypothetical protein [Mangrovivirga halotolerans]